VRRSLPAEEEARRMKLYNQGLSDTEIGEVLGMTTSGVCCWRNSRGLPANRGKRSVREQDLATYERRLKMYHAGVSCREIARREGVTIGAIYNWRNGSGLTPPTMPKGRKTTGRRSRRGVLLIQAFERDLLWVSDQRDDDEGLDVGKFIEAWRDDRASEVIEMIERGVLR